MAGIGFVLRKLTRRQDVGGMIRGYLHALFASSGPWILTILTVWAFYYVGSFWRLTEYIEEFRTIILYNFSFSLAFSAPLTMLATRMLADDFYELKVTRVSNLLIAVLSIQLVFSLIISTLFYGLVTTMSLEWKLLSVANFVLISGIWLSMVFISSLKYYSAITYSFVAGMFLAIVLGYALTGFIGDSGLLFGFTAGLAIILSSFIAIIFVEYPLQEGAVFFLIDPLKKYWKVVLMGTFYNFGIWIDKWIMWFAPERRVLSIGLINYPEYDMSLFIAYLTIIPAFAFFLVKQETTFFEYYVTYFKGILQHDPYKTIEKNYKELIKNLMTNARTLLLLQGGICLFTVLMAPTIMEIVGLNLVQIGIFRFGVLGATFQILTLFLIIVLSYFDDRNDSLIIAATFFVTNTIFTILTLQLGFAYYGYGYFLSTVVAFVLGCVLAERYIRNLTYHTFITRNLAGD